MEMTNGTCGVTILGRSGIRYREGTRTLFVDGEIQTGASDFIIYTSSIQIWNDDKQPISDAEKERIIANIEAVFQLQGLSLSVGR
jgi:hypothetical protein